MATQTYKRLAKGQLAATAGTLYTAPGSTTTYVKGIVLFNTGNSSETVKIYEAGTGTSDQIVERILASKETIEWQPPYPLIVSAAGTISGLATDAATVNYWLYGMEEV